METCNWCDLPFTADAKGEPLKDGYGACLECADRGCWHYDYREGEFCSVCDPDSYGEEETEADKLREVNAALLAALEPVLAVLERELTARRHAYPDLRGDDDPIVAELAPKVEAARAAIAAAKGERT